MAVTGLTLRLADALRSQLNLIVDQQTRDLVKAWAEAWDEVAPDLNQVLVDIAETGTHSGVLSRTQLIRSSRLWQALQIIAVQLSDLADNAGVRITADLSAVVREAGEAQAAILGSQLPDGHHLDLDGWDRVDDLQIAAIVDRSTQQITSLTRPLAPQAYAAVRAELVRGVAAGTNPRETARRMVQRAEGRFNGGLTRALTISRTETLDAHRAAAKAAQDANADTLRGWAWLAKLDSRTCPACWALNGTEHPLAEPGPLGHQQCRCARTPVTKTWADLGFDDIDEPESVLPDAEARFAELSPAEQLAILGPRRFAAWQAGDYPMSQWAVRRENRGWRDAFYTSNAPGDRPGPSRRQEPSTPATPKAGGTSSRAATGTPLADALSPTPLLDKPSKQAVDDALRLITDTQGDVNLQGVDRLPVTSFSEPASPAGRQVLGSYAFDRGTGQSLALRINRLDDRKLATLIHELGHLIDHKHLGDPNSFATVSDSRLQPLMNAIKTSRVYVKMQLMRVAAEHRLTWVTLRRDSDGQERSWSPAVDMVDYMLEPEELFARAYTQWVALRSGDSTLLAYVRAEATPPIPDGWTLIAGDTPGYPQQWEWSDFDGIARQFDDLFGRGA